MNERVSNALSRSDHWTYRQGHQTFLATCHWPYVGGESFILCNSFPENVQNPIYWTSTMSYLCLRSYLIFSNNMSYLCLRSYLRYPNKKLYLCLKSLLIPPNKMAYLCLRSYLIPPNKMPYHAQDQLSVTTNYILWTWSIENTTISILKQSLEELQYARMTEWVQVC